MEQRPFGEDAPDTSAGSNRPMGEQLMDQQEEPASEQEQAQYDLVVSRAIKFMHGPGKDQVLKMLGSGNRPAESLGIAAATLAKSIKQSADEAGKPLDDGVLFHAGTEIVQELAELGREAGVFKFSSEDEENKEVEEGFLYALKNYGESGLADGSISEDEINQSKQIMQQGIDSEAKYGNPSVRQGVQQAMAGGKQPPAGPVQNPGIINTARG